ncbi:MAG: response regulator [Desulfobacterales bacterium]|nr:response regulator [Desulfobacterales bacterium]
MKDEDKTKKQLIDELLKARRQLKEYSEMLAMVPDIVYRIDADGHFLYINSTVRDLGYSPEELTGKHFSQIIHPADVACVSRAAVLQRYKEEITGDKNAPKLFDERRTGRRVTKSLLVRLIQKDWRKDEDSQSIKDSKTMYGEVVASGQYDAAPSRKDKTFLGTVGTIRDTEGRKHVEGHRATVGIIRNITERKLFEQQKEQFQEQLQQSRKMEAVGELAAGIAHGFNNLLMAIQGNVSLILLDIDSTHPIYERLKKVERHVQSASKLTGQLLGYARKGRYEVKPIDLNQVVEESSEAFGSARKEITIHQELAGDLFAIEADQGQVEQVLLNLCLNAADAMPGGGNLILKTMNTTHKDMRGKRYDPNPGNYVLLTVTDTGMGMDKEIIERIFDPFFTTKEMGQGTGLGLASAYGIIKSHGGYIDVDSKKGEGTTFSIYLPASERKGLKAVKTVERLVQGTGTVLLVDDEDVILEIGRELLEALGYRVLLAEDGKEAVEVYRKDQDGIDIIILDMVMPDMGGGEAYDRMKEINPDVKVLLSSGYSIDGEATEILERGCDGFIQKPFNIKELSGKIREILGKE